MHFIIGLFSYHLPDRLCDSQSAASVGFAGEPVVGCHVSGWRGLLAAIYNLQTTTLANRLPQSERSFQNGKQFLFFGFYDRSLFAWMSGFHQSNSASLFLEWRAQSSAPLFYHESLKPGCILSLTHLLLFFGLSTCDFPKTKARVASIVDMPPNPMHPDFSLGTVWLHFKYVFE